MSVAKVIEISARSSESFDDAVKRGVAKASETVNNIRSAWVKEMHAEVDGGTVSAYRVVMKVTFVLGD
ncbi:MAG: dodecin family protein [Longimicrobiales bacterium]|nr:dodecin family protein [Longimicrobiales bacterium]